MNENFFRIVETATKADKKWASWVCKGDNFQKSEKDAYLTNIRILKTKRSNENFNGIYMWPPKNISVNTRHVSVFGEKKRQMGM